MTQPPLTEAARKARARRNIWLALAHVLLVVVILAAFVYVQSQK
ncbi:MAG: hypothetical protein ACPGZP_06615 [Panacagrimonas sp.]